MGANWIGTWEGGRVRDVDGRKVWVIERRIGGGVRRVIRLDVHSEEDARAELALFTRNPLGYRTQRQLTARAVEGAEAAVLDAPTLERFLKDAARECTPEYVEYVLGTYLREWAVKLNRRDLGAVDLPELQRILDGWDTARHKRIVALKSFTAWLRERGLLRRSADPTLDLKVPQPKPEQAVRAKGYSMREVEQVYAEIPSQLLRDVLCLRAKTGMHDTEIARVARGQAVLKAINDPCGIAGTVTFQHLKGGMVHTISLDAQTFAAAQRLQARGSPLTRAPALVMMKRAANRLRAACKTEKEREAIRVVSPGELRHSFSTWATEHGRLIRPTANGLPVSEVAAVMGHLNTRTTKGFYVSRGVVPPMISIPLWLVHPADPGRARRTAARSSASN